MPHLHIKEFKTVEFPSTYDEVAFNFISTNANNEIEKLISVSVEDEDFFLLVKEEENRIRLKKETSSMKRKSARKANDG